LQRRVKLRIFSVGAALVALAALSALDVLTSELELPGRRGGGDAAGDGGGDESGDVYGDRSFAEKYSASDSSDILSR